MNQSLNKANLALTLRDNMRKAGDRPTITFLNRGEVEQATTLTGYELHNLALKKASIILKRTTVLSEMERPVILAMSPGLDFITALFACVYAGVTIVTVPVSKNRISLERLKGIVDDCNATDILTDQVGTNTFQTLISLNEESKLNVVCLPKNDDINNQDPVVNDLPGFLKPNTANAFVQYTSGSSKAPKGVVLSSQNVLHNSSLVAELWEFDENTIMGNWLPHYHDMGLMGGIFYSILNGGRLVLMSPMAFAQKPIRWLKMISAFSVTVSGAPPFAFGQCLNQSDEEELKQLDLSTWKTAYCGAETVFRKVLDDFREKFKPMGLASSAVFACYGMAEITLFAGGQPSQHSNEKSASNLLIEPCVLSEKPLRAIEIVDPDSNVLLEDGQKGEVWLQSDSLGRGYLKGKKELPLEYHTSEFRSTHSQLDGEWFRTGDLGVKLNDHLYVHGRVKDTIIVNGLNVSAADIEWFAGEVHAELNGLGAAAFTTSADQEGRAHLLIETKLSKVQGVDMEEVEASIRSRIRFYFSVELDDVLILKRGTLDRTSSGKVRRMQIASKFDRSFYQSAILNQPKTELT